MCSIKQDGNYAENNKSTFAFCMNIYFLMHDALFHLQRGSSLDILPRENISRRLWHLLGHQALPWNMALIMMGNMAYGLERDGAKSEEHDHETLEIFIEVPGVNVTLRVKNSLRSLGE